MKMSISLSVNTRHEAKAIRRVLADPDMRAFVVMLGFLLELPTHRARVHAMRLVKQRLTQDDQRLRHG